MQLCSITIPLLYPDGGDGNFYSYFPAASAQTVEDVNSFAQFYDAINNQDLEPDIFYFSFGGHSGKFLLIIVMARNTL